jgi:cell division protease FtsH
MIQSPRDTGGERNASSLSFRRRALLLLAAAVPVLVALYVVLLLLTAPATNGRQLRLDEFRTMAQQGRIHSADVLDRDARIIGDSDSGPYWVALPVALVPDVLGLLQQAGVPTVVDQQWWKGLLQPLSILAPTLLLVDAFLLIFLLSRGPDPLAAFSRSSARLAGGPARVTFKDVAGADEAVQELQEVRDFLIAPQRFRGMGARVPKGVLVSGPPGCGKTLLARAVAGESGVPFLSISGSDFVELYVGVGAARIRDLFRDAKRRAPAIVFIDELDAVGRSRMVVGGQDEREATLNQLLVEMDGFDTSEGVVVLAATNRPDILDPALLRPGRFDRRLLVDQPDVRGRAAILRIHARAKPLDGPVDLDQVARRTPGFSGADLANVMNEAALLATRRGRPSIGTPELDEAVDRVVAGPERRSRILGPHERRVIAFHESGHALTAARLKEDAVSKISIVSRGYMLGYTRALLEEDRLILSRSQLLNQLTVLHAGRAAEELGVGEMSSGGQDDLVRATELVRKMVVDFGMSQRLGPVALRGRDGLAGSDPVEFSESLQAEIDGEIRELMQSCYRRALDILTRERATLDDIVDALMDKETLEGGELARLLAPAQMSNASIDVGDGRRNMVV